MQSRFVLIVLLFRAAVLSMGDLDTKVRNAIRYLRDFEPDNESYYVCYSGGKDSDCVRILCDLANVKYELVHNHTSADAPETVYYIRSIPNVIINHNYYADGKVKTMWNLIPQKKFPPTRLVRYCCLELKEYGGVGRLKVTGVRSSESFKRSKNAGLVNFRKISKSNLRLLGDSGLHYALSSYGTPIFNMDNPATVKFVHQCFNTGNVTLQPIIDWSDSDVWQFLKYYGCSANPLYQCGFKRVGCVGCPLGGSKSQSREFARYPKIRDNYIRAFHRMYLKDPELYSSWRSGVDVYKWWLGEDPFQLSFFDDLEGVLHG